MSLPNKIILLLLLLVVFITVCVYTKAGQIYSELTIPTAELRVEETQPEQVPQEQPVQEVQPQEQGAVEPTVPSTQETQAPQEQTVQPTQVPLTPEEELKKVQEVTAVKEEESPLETQQNMEKIIEQNFEEEKKQNAEVSNNESLQEQINKLLVNNGIVFQRMSSNIANESKETLEKIAKIIIDNPTIKIEIAGHTDGKGDDSFNQTVSEQRANSVKSRLVELGVNADRLIAKGYGETMPLVANDEEGYSLVNRRVEFNIIEE